MTMLEKTTRMNFLFDFYQALLTPKQRNYMSLYYLDDLSLGEIAEEFDISRQAVYDNIKRTEIILEEYEEKLQLFSKFKERKKIIKQIKECLTESNVDLATLTQYVHLLEEMD